jgi:hypothetical protein
MKKILQNYISVIIYSYWFSVTAFRIEIKTPTVCARVCVRTFSHPGNKIARV